MSAPPPPHTTHTSNLLSTHRALLDTLTSFLTVCTHHILYLRRLYPPISFLSTRAYNYPVRQNRHPAVCTWINDAVAAIRDQFEKNTVEKVSLCIYETERNQVLEKWTWDFRGFPVVSKRDRDVPFEAPGESARGRTGGGGVVVSGEGGEAKLEKTINVADLEASFRATLSRISTSATKLKPLPELDESVPGGGGPECSFTLTIEVKDSADRPVGRLEREERKWIAEEPESFSFASVVPGTTTGATSFKSNDSNKTIDITKEKDRTHAIRRLEAGELRMEIWVEESAAKFEYETPKQRTADDRRAEMSYGAGTEKFDPIHGYDDVGEGGADMNKKPQGGANTDYQR